MSPASRGNQNVSPLDLLEPWLFPNVDTLHFNWLDHIQMSYYPVQFKPPADDRCWPTIRHLSLQMRMIDHDDDELLEHDECPEIRMLFNHFNFPELRTFSLELTIPWLYMHWQCEVIAEHIQERKWKTLESGELVIHVPMYNMDTFVDDPDMEDPMAEEEAVWTALEIAAKGILQGTNLTKLSLGLIFAFRPEASLFEDGVLERSQNQPYRMLVDSYLIATENRCDTLFQRLRDFHPLIKVLKLDVDAKIDHAEAGNVYNMISYQRTAADDTAEERIDVGADLLTARGSIPRSFYNEYLVKCGQQLDNDLEPYRRSLVAEPEEPIASAPSEPSVLINRPGQSKLHDLPDELIANIVEHLASMGPLRPFPLTEVKRPCACTMPGADFRRRWLSMKDSKLPEESTDPALAPSCVSRKLRQIAFDERPERMYTLGFCAEAMENVTYLPLAMRRNVTRLSLFFPTGACLPAIHKKRLFSPWYLFQDQCFPNVHTFHVKWTDSLARVGKRGGLIPPSDTTGYPSVKTFICEIDPLETAEMEMLFDHFKFPDLRNFAQMLALVHEEIEEECDSIGNYMQGLPMNWSSLDTLKLDLNIEADSVQNVSFWVAFEYYATEMLEAATGVTALQLAITFDIVPSDSLFDEHRGLLCRQPESPAISFHPSLLPVHQQCIEVFQRLKALHAPLKTLDIDAKARAGSELSAKIYPVLQAHVAEDGIYAGADPIRTTRVVREQGKTPCGYYNNFSAQAIIALANDVHAIKNSADAWDVHPDYPGAVTGGPDGLVVNLKEVLWNLRDEPEEVDGGKKLSKFRSWREGCSSAEAPFTSSDAFDAVLLNLPDGPREVDTQEKLGRLKSWMEGCMPTNIPSQELLN